MDFDTAFTLLVDPQHEGGYVFDKNDPGGETYKGVSRRGAPTWAGWQLIERHRAEAGFPANLDGDAALQDAVRSFYNLQYWGPAGCDAVPDPLKYELFDFAVNAGRVTAIKVLQQAAGADAIDGVLGPNTLLRAQSADPGSLLRRFFGYAIQHYTHIPQETRDRFLAGWMNRVATNLLQG